MFIFWHCSQACKCACFFFFRGEPMRAVSRHKVAVKSSKRTPRSQCGWGPPPFLIKTHKLEVLLSDSPFFLLCFFHSFCAQSFASACHHLITTNHQQPNRLRRRRGACGLGRGRLGTPNTPPRRRATVWVWGAGVRAATAD